MHPKELHCWYLITIHNVVTKSSPHPVSLSEGIYDNRKTHGGHHAEIRKGKIDNKHIWWGSQIFNLKYNHYQMYCLWLSFLLWGICSKHCHFQIDWCTTGKRSKFPQYDLLEDVVVESFPNVHQWLPLFPCQYHPDVWLLLDRPSCSEHPCRCPGWGSTTWWCLLTVLLV